MPRLRENIIRFFNLLFKRNTIPMIENVTNKNYNEYHKTYNTLFQIFSKLDGANAYLIGGISAAIQTNQDLYRQNSDIDIMCNEAELSRLIEILQKTGYSIDDRRGIKTRNTVDSQGNFQAFDHELNAYTRNKNMLDVGIFTYQVKGNEVVTHSYAYEENESRIVGIEKVIPKELFDLMYDNRIIDYKGIKLKTQSKEYIYVTKSRSHREKDKIDASIIEPTLDDTSNDKISRIIELEAKMRTYRLLYDKDGKVISKTKLPTLEEKVNAYLDSLYMKDTTKKTEQIIADVFQSDEYHNIVRSHPEIDKLIENWRNKTKNYTYKNKIELLTQSYSKRLKDFSKESIDNALDFLQRRQINHGKSDNDIELSDEAKEIFKLMEDYGQSIKKIFVDNDINLVHITNIAPEKLEGGEIRKSIDKANNYETERVDGVFASSSTVDGNNPYLACNNSGMIRFGNSTYIYGSDNINVIQDSEGQKHAVLKQSNYIYYLNPATFTPICNLTINPRTHQPIFEFSEEWISNIAIDIYNPNQMRGVDEIKDVTSLLEHYTILCDTQSQGIGINARQLKSKKEMLQYVSDKIKDGSLRNINHETGINDRDLTGIDR